MTNFTTSATFVFLFVCALTAAAVPPKPTRPVNYVVLLDLSDRLLVPGQARRDVALVQAVFDRFEQGVRQQLIINAHDRFRVAVAPQKGIRYRPETYMDALYLDLGTLPMARKRQQLDELKAKLPSQLTALYVDALAGRKQGRDFAGCDLWQYVNEQLSTDLDPAYDNVLVVMTDGYFDFEHTRNGATARALKQGNRATDSRMLDRLRRDPNWRQTLARPTEGLIPVTKPLPNLRVCVAEVRPKYDNLNESDLLTALWSKWLRDMKISRWAVQVQGSQPKSLARLSQFLGQ